MLLLTDVKDLLEKLPRKKERKILAGSMKKYATLTADATSSLKSSVYEAGYASTVFPEEDFAKVLIRVRQAVTVATKLRKRLVDDINAVAKNASEQDVTRLAEQARAARAALRERWQTLLSARIEPHEKLVGVVRGIPELAPKGGAKLGALLDELRRQVSHVPTSQVEADSIRASLDDLPRVIEGLGLEGEVGEFLVQAANGLGDPEKLYRPGIRDFFKGRDLWGLIRVKIR